MNCHECRDIMKGFIDGDVGSEDRKRVAWHVADCKECMRLMDDDQFWNNAVLSVLDREAPDDLRQEILGNLAEPRYDDLTGKQKLKIIAWAARRNPPGLGTWLWVVVLVVLILLFTEVWPVFR